METEIQVTDPTQYDTDALVAWYIQLRDYKSELKKSIQPALNQTDAQMDAIERTLSGRLIAANAVSLKTTHGTIGRVQKTKFTVTDPYALRQWVIANPEIGVNLLSGSVSQAELNSYLADNEHAVLPEGIAQETIFDISVRRS